jgi:hypothetical protein
MLYEQAGIAPNVITFSAAINACDKVLLLLSCINLLSQSAARDHQYSSVVQPTSIM